MRKLDNIRLTDTQKKVLTRIVASPNDKLAAEQISKGRNMRAARDMLVKLGLITADEQTAAVTDAGTDIMTTHNLTDEGGELTDEGNKFAYDEKDSKAAEPEPTKEDPFAMDKPSRNPFESALIRSVNNEINMLEEARKFS